MKRFVWAAAGVCAAAVGLLVWGSKRTPRLEGPSETPKDAPADRQTAA
jgi:hypothetical protein